ncbi:MAG: hypothetical protein NUW01_06755 [Gemmatimonadaceae bacterium]|nr:hypothetical protein [Gemmatimonadaceae bacterium]
MSHFHRWRIAEPAGPTSQGTCDCGVTREFPNADPLDYTDGAARWRTVSANRTIRKRRRTIVPGRERNLASRWEAPL